MKLIPRICVLSDTMTKNKTWSSYFVLTKMR